MGLRLTSSGQNLRPRFSPDGRKILFVSSRRESHANSQLYEINLDSFRERRVTYHDGDCLEGDYTPDGKKLIYASTTDELKEHPILLNPRRSFQPPTELYLSDPRGMEIDRLTHQAGYQGQIAWVSPNHLLHVTEGKERLQLESLILAPRQSVIWRLDKDAQLQNPAVDLTGTRIAWTIENSAAPPRLGLKLQGRFQTLDVPFEQIQSLQWTKSAADKAPRLLMTAKKKGDPFLGGWLLDVEQKCLLPLLREQGQLKDLRATANQEKLVFVLEARDDAQIYLREFPALTAACEPLTGAPPEPAPASR